MREPVKLRIPQPCHEKWAEMEPDEKGRFCLSCQKTVVDFSTMTDRQVLEYFSNYTGNTCGRFSSDQLNRDIAVGVQKPTLWYKYVLSLFVPAMMLANKAMTQGRIALQRPVQTTSPARVVKDSVPVCVKPTPEPDFRTMSGVMGAVAEIRVITIEGKVVDEDGTPIPFARISIKGTDKVTKTDVDGKFSIWPSSMKKVTLEIGAVGFQLKEVRVKVGDHTKSPFMLVPMEPMVLGFVLSDYKETKPTIFQRFTNFIKDSMSSKKSLMLYPNAAKTGSAVTVVYKLDKGRYLISVINTNGQTMQEDILNVGSKTDVTSFQLNKVVIAGQYAVVITDNKGKIVTSGQLIVQ